MKAEAQVGTRQECGRVVVVAVTGDILRLTSYFHWGTIEARMVAFWRFTQIDEIVPTEAIIARFYHEWMNSQVWQLVGYSGAQLYRTVCDNLSNELSLFGDFELAHNGGRGDTAMPAFNAMSVKQVVASRETRAGYKRVPFITEALNLNGNVDIETDDRLVIESFFGTTMTVIDDVMEEEVGLMSPVVIGRINVGTEEAPVYELDIDVQNNILSAIIQQKLTTQNSRKT